jgi:hypothetical protein
MVADELREQDASEWSWSHSLVELSSGGATDAVHVKVRIVQVRDFRQDGRCETSSGCRSGRTRTPVVTVDAMQRSDVLRAVVNSESVV